MILKVAHAKEFMEKEIKFKKVIYLNEHKIDINFSYYIIK